MLHFLDLLYYFVMAILTLGFYFVVKKKTMVVKKMVVIAMILTGLGTITLILTEHRLPLYGAFEASFYLIFVLTLLEIFFWKNQSPCIHLKSCGVTLLYCFCLLLYHIMQPKEFNPDFFMYGNPWVNLFFNLRLTAAAIFSRTALLYQMGIWGERSKQTILFSHARTVLLWGLVVFLCSEWAGSWWCLNWLGDSWQWSKGFFKAAIVFMLVMLTCHLPPSLMRKSWIKGMTGSLPALFLMWTIFYH
ncbi:hypothetical protein SAMN02746065_1472 [Desulfocicer vacuolatum DSM 3385]|uniref:Cytochrome c assembly protein domain-containing protein n=1 Tax=Desulfocicer vacuolatum DSM 3385 TaxID=1121400 RepID=A0A1W2EUB4_9BACT|nr:hypothetical protein [Desulfocicer vacuolatum]SMD13172.1 hypothetical protein SAMN02746065_1472 [Desulfocicer vacuolatum DSM 3385]